MTLFIKSIYSIGIFPTPYNAPAIAPAMVAIVSVSLPILTPEIMACIGSGRVAARMPKTQGTDCSDRYSGADDIG